jgi:hypothetical protein
MLLLLRAIRNAVTKLFVLFAWKYMFCVVSSFSEFTELHCLLSCCIECVEVTDRLI